MNALLQMGSIALQVAAALTAALVVIRLARFTGWRAAWALILTALALVVTKGVFSICCSSTINPPLFYGGISALLELIIFILFVAALIKLKPIVSQSKQAAAFEDDVFTSVLMLQLILDTIPQRIFWKDRNYKYLGCNKLFAKDAQLRSPYDIIGKDDFELIWKESAPLYRADDKHVMETNTVKLNFEEPLSKPDGSRLWLRTSKMPLHNSKGELVGVMGMYEDITERKAAEEEMRRSEEKFTKAFNASPVIMCLTAMESERIIEVNRAFERKTGYLRSEIKGRSAAEFSLWRYPEDLVRASKKLNEGRSYYGLETEYRTKGGETRLGLISAERVEFGGDPCLLMVVEDITDRKKMEILLKESEERYRRVVEKSDTGFVVVDDHGKVLEANEPYLRLVGASRMDEIMGRSVIEWTAPEEKENNLAAVTHCAQKGFIQDFKTVYVQKSGDRIVILVNAATQDTAQGKRLIALCRNITEHKGKAGL